MLWPLAMTDLRASFCPVIFGTDASLHIGAVVSARVPLRVAEEVWRGAEHVGWATKLGSSLESWLCDMPGEPLGGLPGFEEDTSKELSPPTVPQPQLWEKPRRYTKPHNIQNLWIYIIC